MGIYSVKSVEQVMREKGLPDDGKGPRWLVLGNEGVTVATTWTKVEATSLKRAKEREATEAANAYRKSLAASRTIHDTPEASIVALCEYSKAIGNPLAVAILKMSLDFSVAAQWPRLQNRLEELTAQWANE